MRRSDFWLAYFLLLTAQLALSNYVNFSLYVTLSILPVMVLCIPIRVATVPAMLVAMGTGLCVDLLTEGLLGLNALALVPVAYIRKPLIRRIFGSDLLSRKEDFTVQRNGYFQVAAATLVAQALFLLVYIWADGAGERPLWFLAARFGASLACGLLLSLLTLDALASPSKGA